MLRALFLRVAQSYKFRVCGLFLCTFGVSLSLATVRLEITDSDGAKMEYAGAGQPFRVSVETDAQSVNSRPTIEGINEFLCGETSFREMITPSAKISRFGYVARIDEPGTYTIGPARMQVDGHEETSEALQLEVKQEAKTIGASDKRLQSKPFARFTVSQHEIFVREPVTCTLRFYFSRTNVRNVSLQLSESESTVVIDRYNPQQGTETIDGKTWNYVEWSWRLYAKKAGSITIPACAVGYEEVQSGGFFFSSLQQKQLYSNAVTLEVKALPACSEPIQAVGSFERFEVRAEPSVARAGDALVVTLRVEGSGLFDDAQPVTLREVPAALKWYESKKDELHVERDGVEGKSFEFVVQGLQEGEWQIPEQHFSYFDTQVQQCRMLVSTPVSITITLGQAVAGMVPTLPTTPHSFVHSLSDDLAPLITGDGFSWWARNDISLPWWLMLALVLVPSLVVAMVLLRHRLLQTSLVRKKTIFSGARGELAALARRGDVQDLYALFTRFFARLYDDPAVDLASEKLQMRLRNAGLKSETLERWQQFVDRCAECAFYTVDAENVSKESLLVVAEQWLIFFKERL